MELGEIESVLHRHPSVAMAAAVAIPDDKIGNRIIAFVQLRDRTGITDSVLESFCSKYLPVYMIPEKFSLLTRLPQTSTGKIDRNRLRGNPKEFFNG